MGIVSEDDVIRRTSGKAQRIPKLAGRKAGIFSTFFEEWHRSLNPTSSGAETVVVDNQPGMPTDSIAVGKNVFIHAA